MTQRVLRYLVAVAGLLFLAIGVGLLLAPGRQAAMFAIVPSGSAGLSTIRADLAGLFLVMGACAVIGAMRGSVTMLAIPTTLLAVIAAGRFVNLIADGSSPDALRSLGVELVVGTLLVLTIASLRKSKSVRLGAVLAIPVIVLAVLGGAYAFQRPLGLSLMKRFVDQGMANQLVSSLPDGLHVGLCGSGSPMPDATRSGPCAVVIAGRTSSSSTSEKAGRASWR